VGAPGLEPGTSVLTRGKTEWNVGAPGLEPGTSVLTRDKTEWNVGAPGLEPGTSVLSGLRSSQLSYAPLYITTPFKINPS
jgi:hypothetical protein